MDIRNRLAFLENHPLPEAKRLVILVPEDANETSLGRLVWELASLQKCDVLYLMTARNYDEESRARHKLAALYSFTCEPRIHVETALRFGQSWAKAIQSLLKPGDLLLCFQGHTVLTQLFRRKPIQKALVEQIKAPVYTLPTA
jgi:hypothetical protein